MRIHNPSNLPLVDYRRVQDLQGNLKDLHTDNHDKLLRVLEKRGFTAPLLIWINEGVPYLCDGHQRVRVMKLNELSDNGNFEVPYVEIKAANEKEAKEMLLEITSQYGTVTIDGLDEFAFDLDIPAMDINFDALNMELLKDEMKDQEDKKKATKYTIKQLLDLANGRGSGEEVIAFLNWVDREAN